MHGADVGVLQVDLGTDGGFVVSVSAGEDGELASGAAAGVGVGARASASVEELG